MIKTNKAIFNVLLAHLESWINLQWITTQPVVFHSIWSSNCFVLIKHWIYVKKFEGYYVASSTAITGITILFISLKKHTILII